MKSAIGSGLNAACPPAITSGSSSDAVRRVQRHPREVERGEQVGVAQLGRERDAEHVEVAERAVAVDGELRHPRLPHQRLEVGPDRIRPLGEGVGPLVEDLVEDHDALVRDADLVGVGVHQRPAHRQLVPGGTEAAAVPVLGRRVQLAADVLDGLTDPLEQRLEGGPDRGPAGRGGRHPSSLGARALQARIADQTLATVSTTRERTEGRSQSRPVHHRLNTEVAHSTTREDHGVPPRKEPPHHGEQQAGERRRHGEPGRVADHDQRRRGRRPDAAQVDAERPAHRPAQPRGDGAQRDRRRWRRGRRSARPTWARRPAIHRSAGWPRTPRSGPRRGPRRERRARYAEPPAGSPARPRPARRAPTRSHRTGARHPRRRGPAGPGPSASPAGRRRRPRRATG